MSNPVEGGASKPVYITGSDPSVGGGGGGAVTIADGADVAKGASTDAAASSTVAETATARTGISLWKGIKNVLLAIRSALPTALGTGGGIKVDGSGTALPVSGTVTISNPAASQPGFSIPVTLTVTNGVYSIGDVVGGLITLSNIVSGNGKSCILTDVVITSVATLAYNLLFRSEELAGGTIADNGAYAEAAADGANNLPGIAITTDLYLPTGTGFNRATVRTGVVLKAGVATASIFAYMTALATTTPGTNTIYMRFEGFMLD
jgi:hypothetical protein